MSAPQTCSDCRRPLLLSNGAEICAWTPCPIYGRDQADEEPKRPHPQDHR